MCGTVVGMEYTGALSMVNKAQILFTCSEEFKEAIGDYAQKHNISVAALIRDCVAEFIGYDISKEEIDDKRKKYANAEERKEAQRQRQRLERAEVAKLLEAFAQEQRQQDAKYIADGLLAKGVL